MGTVAMLASFLISFAMAAPDRIDLPIEHSKDQGGHAIDYLGNREYVGYGIVDITTKRRQQCRELHGRFQSLQRIERDELQSNNGRHGFVAIVIPGIRPFLARAYRAVHRDNLWRYDKRCGAEAMATRDWLRQDNKALTDIIMKFQGRALMIVPPQLPDSPIPVAYTDANRPKRLDKYAGLGGYVVFPSGEITFWHIRLPRRIVQTVPIHVTERLAPEITLAVTPALQHCQLLQRIDNMAATCSLQRQRSSDPRLQDLELIHLHQTGRKRVSTLTLWIDTKSNLWADLLSRGEIEEFKRLARAAGCLSLTEIDLARAMIPRDLPDMFRRLHTMTSLLPSKTRLARP